MLRSDDVGIHYEAVGVIGNLVHSSQHIKKTVLQVWDCPSSFTLTAASCAAHAKSRTQETQSLRQPDDTVSDSLITRCFPDAKAAKLHGGTPRCACLFLTVRLFAAATGGRAAASHWAAEQQVHGEPAGGGAAAGPVCNHHRRLQSQDRAGVALWGCLWVCRLWFRMPAWHASTACCDAPPSSDLGRHSLPGLLRPLLWVAKSSD